MKFGDFYQKRLAEDVPVPNSGDEIPKNQPGEVSGGWRTGQTGGAGGEEGWAQALAAAAQSLPDFGLRQTVSGLDEFEPEKIIERMRQERAQSQQPPPQQPPQQQPPQWLGIGQQSPGMQ